MLLVLFLVEITPRNMEQSWKDRVMEMRNARTALQVKEDCVRGERNKLEECNEQFFEETLHTVATLQEKYNDVCRQNEILMQRNTKLVDHIAKLESEVEGRSTPATK